MRRKVVRASQDSLDAVDMVHCIISRGEEEEQKKKEKVEAARVTERSAVQRAREDRAREVVCSS